MTRLASPAVTIGYPTPAATAVGLRRPHRLPSLAVSLGLLGCLLGAPAMTLLGSARPTDAAIASAMCFVAIVVASSRPALLPVIVMAYTVGNRLIRRLLDYAAGEFSEVPPTSLVVPALCLIMGVAVLSEWKTLPKKIRKASSLIACGLAYGAVVGVGWGAGMVFELISWLGPLGFGLYVAWLRPTRKQVTRFVMALAVFVGLGLAYGWVQWLILPPWDEFWVRHCGMGSIGGPYPMRCRFFGSFGAHGAAATFGATAAALLLMFPRYSAAVRIPLASFLAITSIMPGVRSACLAGVAMLMVWFALRRGGGARVMGPLLVAMVAGMLIVPSLPGGDGAIERMGTLGNLSSDGSFRGRVVFSFWAIGQVLQRPYGYGLGSSGLGATRLGGGEIAAFDSGYLQPFYALGVPGGLLLLTGIWRLLRGPIKRSFWIGAEDSNLGCVIRAVIAAMAVQMIVSNALRGDFACLFWMFVMLAHVAPHRLSAAGTRQSVRLSQATPTQMA